MGLFNVLYASKEYKIECDGRRLTRESNDRSRADQLPAPTAVPFLYFLPLKYVFLLTIYLNYLQPCLQPPHSFCSWHVPELQTRREIVAHTLLLRHAKLT